MPTTQQTIQKVREFAQLPEGWHFGEGVPPSQERIEQAVGFLEYADLSNLGRSNAFPGVSGQVEVTFYNADRMLEITIEPDDSITVAEDQENEQVSLEENLSKSDAYRRLEEFSQNIWASSDHFIVSTMTQNVRVAGSLVPLWISVIENLFRLSMWNVRREQAALYAHISFGTMTNKPALPRFIGELPTISYRPIVEWSLRERKAATTAIGTFTGGEEAPFVVHSDA